jgi:hypothetical protein
MNPINRLFIYGPFVLFVLLATGLSVRWWYVADDFSRTLDKANGRQIAPGVTLHFGSKRIAGFPFRLDAVFKGFSIEVATPHGPSRWQSDDFALHRLTYGRGQMIFEAAGRQTLRWTRNDGSSRSLALSVGSIHASAIESDDVLSRADIVIVGVVSAAFAAREIQLHLRHDPARDALNLFVSANDIHLPAHSVSSFGDSISAVEVTTTLNPGKSFDGLRAGEAQWPNALDSWRQASGTAQLDDVLITFGRFSARGTGMLAIDANKRPEGIVDFKIAGISQFLSEAGKRGLGGGKGKGLGPALIDRAAKAGSDDMGRIGVVLGFKDGVAYLGDEAAGTVAPLY